MDKPIALWVVQYGDDVYLYKDAYNALCKFNAFVSCEKLEFTEICICDNEMIQYRMYDTKEETYQFLKLFRVHTRDDKDNSYPF